MGRSEDRMHCKIIQENECSISNTMYGTEDDLHWQEDDEDVVTREAITNQDEDETELENPYDDMVTAEEWEKLFGESGDKEFDGLGSSVNGNQISYFYVSCRFHEQCTLSVSCHRLVEIICTVFI